jgi:hypothetical protein
VADIIQWPVVLVCPDEEELTLMADLSARRDARIVAVVDPEGFSIGAGLAEVMGVPVVQDLDAVERGVARYLVHPPLDDSVAPIVDRAAEHGLEPVAARDFAALLAGPRLDDPAFGGGGVRPPAPPYTGSTRPGPEDFDLLEIETAAIHRTLSRIEEALDREALLRWLLGLATRATGATSGSIMLYDEGAEELYVAFAYGLSQHTVHRTRVRLGQGIAGQVAETRQARIISDNRHPGARRDRSQISSAVCAPVIWEGRLLGVLNVSVNEGEGRLDQGALKTIESLVHRFAMILDRFLRLQAVRDGEFFRFMEEELSRDTGHPQAVANTLQRWAEDLKEIAGADHAGIGVLTSDGDLFLAWPDGTEYESPPLPEKTEVLSTGRPLVLRPGDRSDADPTDVLSEVTLFVLPVGRDPLRALLTLEFSSAARAHHFHAMSGEILYLVNRHLNDYLDRAATADQVDRLTTLASALSELAAARGGPGHERVLAAASRLTGAGRALLLTREDFDNADFENVGPDGRDLHAEAVRLLSETGQGGWQSTVLETAGDGRGGRSLLVVPLDPDRPFPGLVLIDKQRLHPLDGSGFTEFDALFARRLLPLLDGAVQAPEVSRTSAAAEPTASESALGDILRREMDRCDRYHTMVGLAAFRLAPDRDLPVPVPRLVADLGARLRSSDSAACLEDGTIMVIVPEDIQSLPRLQKRVTELLRAASGVADLTVFSSSRVYPGGGDTPRQLIDGVLGSLP